MLLILTLVIAVILIAAITSEVGTEMDNSFKFSCDVCKFNKFKNTGKIRCVSPFETSCEKVKEEYIKEQQERAKEGGVYIG